MLMVTDDQFEQEVLKSDIPVLVDFYADWCGPCKAQVPALEAVARSFDGRVKVLKLNVDDNQNTALKFSVQSIPTLILFKNGKVVDQLIGAAPKERIRRMVRKHLG